jgi:hypothetical protein
MNLSRLIVTFMIALGATAASAQQGKGNDYPTHEVVEYVFDCMQKHGGINYDTMNKCSCSFDYIASRMTHDEFVTADTFERGQAATGERGEILREGVLADSQRASLEDIRAKSERHCYLPAQTAKKGK